MLGRFLRLRDLQYHGERIVGLNYEAGSGDVGVWIQAAPDAKRERYYFGRKLLAALPAPTLLCGTVLKHHLCHAFPNVLF